MKFTYKWLKRFLDTNLSAEEVAIELTKLGMEVESISDRSKELAPFIVAYIEHAEKHPNADSLRVCQVFDGTQKLQIVCGAPNARAGIKVALAQVGSVIPNGGFTIKEAEIRGAKSCGMMCSADELNLSIPTESGTIIELPSESEVGTSIIPIFGLDDITYDIDVTPNRGDWLGVYGIARDFAAKKLGKLKDMEQPNLKTDFESSITASIESEGCKFFTLREIKGVKNVPSPAWLQNLLRDIGMEPISSIVDITNYFSISYGRPLHAYDRKKVGTNFTAKEVSPNSKFLALNNKEYELSSPDLVIADESGPLSIAGIIGGESSKCSDETTDIVLECALFDKIAITKTGRRHNIFTDSRARLERGVDEARTEYFNSLATLMILEICGGNAGTISKAGSESDLKDIEYDHSILEKRIGITKSVDDSISILEDLGFKILSKAGDKMKLQIPSWRHDVNCQEVIAEEIARICDFEKIEQKQIKTTLLFSRLLTQNQQRTESIRKATASLGYKELITYSFMPSSYAKHFADFNPALQIKNPISSELDYMRPSIIPNLLHSLSYNSNRSAINMSFFEIGPVFKDQSPEGESVVLAAIVNGNRIEKSHSDNAREADIFDIKADIESLINELGLDAAKLKIEQQAPSYYHPGRSGVYKLGKSVVAIFGQIHPLICDLYELKIPAFGFEILLNNFPLPRPKYGRKPKITLSQFQQVQRDFAFLFDNSVEAAEIIRNINSASNLIKNVEIFDLYQGENLPDGKKSIAVRAYIQADDKTLLDKEIEEISLNIISIVQNKLNGELRS